MKVHNRQSTGVAASLSGSTAESRNVSDEVGVQTDRFAAPLFPVRTSEIGWLADVPVEQQNAASLFGQRRSHDVRVLSSVGDGKLLLAFGGPHCPTNKTEPQ